MTIVIILPLGGRDVVFKVVVMIDKIGMAVFIPFIMDGELRDILGGMKAHRLPVAQGYKVPLRKLRIPTDGLGGPLKESTCKVGHFIGRLSLKSNAKSIGGRPTQDQTLWRSRIIKVESRLMAGDFLTQNPSSHPNGAKPVMILQGRKFKNRSIPIK